MPPLRWWSSIESDKRSRCSNAGVVSGLPVGFWTRNFRRQKAGHHDVAYARRPVLTQVQNRVVIANSRVVRITHGCGGVQQRKSVKTRIADQSKRACVDNWHAQGVFASLNFCVRSYVCAYDLKITTEEFCCRSLCRALSPCPHAAAIFVCFQDWRILLD